MGDYDFDSSINTNVAEGDLKEAVKIIDACKEYLAKIYNVSKEYWNELMDK